MHKKTVACRNTYQIKQLHAPLVWCFRNPRFTIVNSQVRILSLLPYMLASFISNYQTRIWPPNISLRIVPLCNIILEICFICREMLYGTHVTTWKGIFTFIRYGYNQDLRAFHQKCNHGENYSILEKTQVWSIRDNIKIKYINEK